VIHNAAIDYIIRTLGLEDIDRLSSMILFTTAVLAWPLTLVFGYPILSTLHARKQTKLTTDN
jgi:hypothetical protein